MNAPAKIATQLAAEIGKPQNVIRRGRSYVSAIAKIDREKHNAVINGTAWTALHILQDEILLTAGRIRNARRAGDLDALRRNTAALFALLRVKKAMRGRYPDAIPHWRAMGEAT